MKNLFLFSLAIFTTLSLLVSCGENGTGNATENATENATVNVVKDSTANATVNVK
jgi:hypothetical protein